MSLLRLWVSAHAGSVGKPALEATCGLLHGIQHAKFLPSTCRSRSTLMPLAKGIEKLYADYVNASKAARGEDECGGFSKQHWLGHVSAQIVRDSAIFDSFAVERLHRRTKKHAEPLANTAVFSRTILKRVTASHYFACIGGGAIVLGTHTRMLEVCSSALHGIPVVAASHPCSYHGSHRYGYHAHPVVTNRTHAAHPCSYMHSW